MSDKAEETSNDCNRICPYCGHYYQVEAEDYDEDAREEACGECGKKYYASDDFSVTHRAVPDCKLNNEEHRWEKPSMYKGNFYLHCERCEACERQT